MKQDWIKVWLKIGKRNPWISEAWDPEFDQNSFYECRDYEHMWEKINECTWCLGQAFYVGDICLIQQVNGGDEWMVIKQNLDFESFSVLAMGKEKFLRSMKCIEKATLQQCKRLEYSQVEVTI